MEIPVQNGCNVCIFLDTCAMAKADSECKLAADKSFELATLADLERLQDDIIRNALLLLKRAEILASQGQVSLSDVDRLRKQAFDFIEKKKKSTTTSAPKNNAKAVLGL